MRLFDTYGISSVRVRQRIDELIKAGQTTDREQAFEIAVEEEWQKETKNEIAHLQINSQWEFGNGT
jgi:hypothetical protein